METSLFDEKAWLNWPVEERRNKIKQIIAEEGEACLNTLCWIVHNDPSHVVRSYAVRTLGSFDCERAIEMLIFVVKNDEYTHPYGTGTYAVIGLLSSRCDKVQNALILAAKNQKIYWEVRCLVVEKLASFGGEQIADVLIEVLYNDRDSDVRNIAAKALASYSHEQVADALIGVLQKGRKWKWTWTDRAAAAESLGSLKGEKVVDTLIDVVKNRKGTSWRDARIAAVKSLASFKTQKVFSCLVDVANNVNDDASIEAVKSISCFKGSRVTEVLLRLLHKRPDIRATIVYTLASCEGDEVAVSILRDRGINVDAFFS